MCLRVIFAPLLGCDLVRKEYLEKTELLVPLNKAFLTVVCSLAFCWLGKEPSQRGAADSQLQVAMEAGSCGFVPCFHLAVHHFSTAALNY